MSGLASIARVLAARRALALLLLYVTGATTAVAEADCPIAETTTYVIDVDAIVPGSVAVNQQLTRRQLGAAAAHGGRGNILGLMHSRLDARSSTSYGYVESGRGFCFWLQEVRVILEFPTVEIYVAREYRPGTCPYRAILDHETDHLRVARNILDPYAAEMRAALTSLGIPKPNAPWFVPDTEAAKAKVEKLLVRILNPIYQRMQTDMAEQQSYLDSHQEYEDVFRRCDNW